MKKTIFTGSLTTLLCAVAFAQQNQAHMQSTEHSQSSSEITIQPRTASPIYPVGGGGRGGINRGSGYGSGGGFSGGSSGGGKSGGSSSGGNNGGSGGGNGIVENMISGAKAGSIESAISYTSQHYGKDDWDNGDFAKEIFIGAASGAVGGGVSTATESIVKNGSTLIGAASAGLTNGYINRWSSNEDEDEDEDEE